MAFAPPSASQPSPYNISPTYLQDILNYQSLMSNPALLYGVPQVDPTTVNPMMLNPTAYTGAVTKSMQPIFRQQDRALQAGLADAGIVGGPTAGAITNLGLTQNQQLAGQIAPMIQQIMQGNQATNLQGQLANQGTNLQGQLANQSTGLQGGEFNASTQNQAQQFDINNLINAGMFDAGAANQFTSQGMQYQNQDWLAQMQAIASMFQGMGQSVSGAYQPIFQQPPNFGEMGYGFGSMMPPMGGSPPPSSPGVGYGAEGYAPQPPPPPPYSWTP